MYRINELLHCYEAVEGRDADEFVRRGLWFQKTPSHHHIQAKDLVNYIGN